MMRYFQMAILSLVILASMFGVSKADQEPLAETKGFVVSGDQISSSGFQLSEFTKLEEHQSDSPNDPDYGQVKLSIEIPQIISPQTKEANEFNNAIMRFSEQFWRKFGGPTNNEFSSDPSTDFNLDCEMVSLQPPVDGYQVSLDEKMLPDVISASCGLYQNYHGAAHGGGEYEGFNWLIKERRQIRSGDVFNLNSRWLTALADAADPNFIRKLNFSDTSHWVLENKGLGLIYSFAEFAGVEDGGMGTFDLIPWSKLAPYLRKNGIVPQKYWKDTH